MGRGALGVLAALLLAAPAASAGTNGNWTPVTPSFDQNFNLVGLYRTGDGVLHVAAQVNNAANPQHNDIIHIPISSGGSVGATSIVSGDWVGTESPDIEANPGGGLLTLWGGIHTTTTGDPLNNGDFATSDDSGSAWTVDPNGPWGSGGTAGGTYVYAEQVSAQNGADGTPYAAWSHSGVYVKRSLDPNATVYDYNQPIGGETTAIPDLANDAGDGSLWLGWENQLGTTGLGVWAQQVDQSTGAPVGSPVQMPGSVTNSDGTPESSAILGRTPITGLPGKAGVWMAYSTDYPSQDKVVVWKVGSSATTTLVDVPHSNFNHVAIAADPDGRLIVLWNDESKHALQARVSDPTVSSWGPAFEIPLPSQSSEDWAMQASGQSGALVDILQNISEGTSGNTMRFWHTQVVAPPVLAKSVDARVISGVVLIKLPGSNTFVPLAHESQIPVGAIVDTTKGRVRVVTALPKTTKTQSADFFQGVFQVAQEHSGLATLALVGGNFKACGKASRLGATAAKIKVIRKLWGAGKGKFRTKGKYASASIRGTTWLTQDRCDGTLIRVTAGSVTVRDLVKKRNVVVTKGHSYLAKKG